MSPHLQSETFLLFEMNLVRSHPAVENTLQIDVTILLNLCSLLISEAIKNRLSDGQPLQALQYEENALRPPDC